MTEPRGYTLAENPLSVWPNIVVPTCDRPVRLWGKTLTCDKPRQHSGDCHYR